MNIEKALVIFTGGLIVFVLIVSGIFLVAIKECNRLGYREARVNYDLSRYCETRINQSDIILPIEEAREKPIN